jgi:hypothetical protein
MMKKHKALLLLNILCLSSMTLNGMENPKAPEGPMNSEWFYDTLSPYQFANGLHQNQQWLQAAGFYEGYLKLLDLTDYDKNMVRLNLAACLMAQRKATKHWKAFDALLNIPEEQRISMTKLENEVDEAVAIRCKLYDKVPSDSNNKEAEYDKINAAHKYHKKMLVRTDKIGIGDIFHFLSALDGLSKNGIEVILSVPNFLIKTLASAAQEYEFTLIGAKDEQPTTDYETHLISLLGIFNKAPANMNPKKVVFTAPERAVNAVLELITPVLDGSKNIAVVFLGENRQATLIGGKQLPRNTEHHGRHLDSEPFNTLLKNHADLVLLDCGGKTSRIAIDEKQKNRYLIIPDEEQAFDTIIALGRIMSLHHDIIGFGADNGPTNVFTRALDNEAQNRMTLVIPNAKEHDMRMEGEGSVYKQMISNCWVAKCEQPSDQTRVIEESYHRMLTYK